MIVKAWKKFVKMVRGVGMIHLAAA